MAPTTIHRTGSGLRCSDDLSTLAELSDRVWSQEDEAYVANLLEFFDSDGNGEASTRPLADDLSRWAALSHR